MLGLSNEKVAKTKLMILATFGLQLGHHPTWVLNAPQATTDSLRPHQASTLAIDYSKS